MAVMRHVEQHQQLISRTAQRPAPLRQSLAGSVGLRCAEDVVAERHLPSFDQAAVDGFAVRAVDVAKALSQGSDTMPLPVVGTLRAGSRVPARLSPGQAVRVETGAPLPTLADAVIPHSWVDERGPRIVVRRVVKSREFVRRAGSDVQQGQIAVEIGTLITPSHIAVLAAVGRTKVFVYPRPRVTVITIGDQYVELDRVPGPGQVYDVCSHTLASAATEAGAEVFRVGVVDSDPARLAETIGAHIARSEIIVLCASSGGGAQQAIAADLADFGALDLTRVAMHPGSGQGFGVLGVEQCSTFLLPDNPATALVIFEVMIRPLIKKELGHSITQRRMITAKMVGSFNSKSGRRGYIRGLLMRDEDTGEYLVDALGDGDESSGQLLTSLTESNCMIVVDEQSRMIRRGDEVSVMFLAQKS